MNADLELYKVFCEVVKYKNISKTAESMYISQSAITQSIQKLENILGGKVFYRNKTGVELTEEGKNLYDYIKDSVETMSNAENIFSKYITLEKGNVRIGGGSSLIKNLLFEPTLNFIKKFPNIGVSISNGATEYLMQKLVNGDMDVVALNLPYMNKNYSNIEIIPLKKSSFCFVASKEYLKYHPVKNFKDFQNHALILPKAPSIRKKILDEYCKQEKIELNAKFEVNSSTIVKKFVINDLGIGFINKESMEDIKDKVEIICSKNIFEVDEAIAVLKKNMCNKATLELIKEIKEYYK